MSEFFIVVNFHNFPQKKDLAAYNLISRSNQSRLTRRGSEAFLDSYLVLGAVDCVLQRWCGHTRRVGGPGEVEYFISGLTHTQLRCEDYVVHTLITQPHELLKLLVWLARAVYPQLTSSIPGLKLLHYKLWSAKDFSAWCLNTFEPSVGFIVIRYKTLVHLF